MNVCNKVNNNIKLDFLLRGTLGGSECCNTSSHKCLWPPVGHRAAIIHTLYIKFRASNKETTIKNNLLMKLSQVIFDLDKICNIHWRVN